MLNRLIQLFLLYSLIAMVSFSNGAVGIVNCDIAEEFARKCTDQFLGVVVNGRCFFVTSEQINFDEAFGVCATYNASFAQIQTQEEFEAIVAHLPQSDTPTVIFPWIALKRPTETTVSFTQMDIDNTYWYDGPDQRNDALKAAQTWIRNRQTDNKNEGNEQCYTLYRRGKYLVFDLQCDWKQTALCLQTSGTQTYKAVPGDCVIAGIISEAAMNAQSCANACVESVSCRSFNMIGSTTCQLVTWTTANNPWRKPVPDCIHYEQKV